MAAGFFTGFVTGFANESTRITQTNEAQRNANIERALAAFRENIGKREEEQRTRLQALQAAQVVGQLRGVPGRDIETLSRSPEAMSMLTDGRLRVESGDAPNAPPTATQGTPQASPTGGNILGVPAPRVSPETAPSTAPATTLPDPREAPVAAPQATPTAPSVAPQAASGSGMMGTVRQAMFGRSPLEGIGEDARNRYMQESGRTPEQIAAIMAPPAAPAPLQGRYGVNAMTPQQMASNAGNFSNAQGMDAFNRTGDTSGLHTADRREEAALRQAQARANARAGSGSGAAAPNASMFNAARAGLAGFMPSNGMIRTAVGPNGEVQMAVGIPSNNPRYAEAQRTLETANLALGRALRGEVEGIPAGDPAAAGAYAARAAGLLGNTQPTSGATPPPASQARPAAPTAQPNPTPTAPQGNANLPRVTDAASFNALPRGARFIDPQGNTRVKP